MIIKQNEKKKVWVKVIALQGRDKRRTHKLTKNKVFPLFFFFFHSHFGLLEKSVKISNFLSLVSSKLNNLIIQIRTNFIKKTTLMMALAMVNTKKKFTKKFEFNLNLQLKKKSFQTNLNYLCDETNSNLQ